MKVELTIRCNRCDEIETVVTESWASLKTSCGCEGPYRIIERNVLPEEETADDNDAKPGKQASAADSAKKQATTDETPAAESTD